MQAALLVLSLTLTGAPDADKKYTVDVTKTTQAVKKGEAGEFCLHIKPADGFKISPDAPLKIVLAANGVSLDKDKLGHADAKDPKSTAPEFTVAFKTSESGEKTIEAEAAFVVCDATICERKKETIVVAVKVGD